MRSTYGGLRSGFRSVPSLATVQIEPFKAKNEQIQTADNQAQNRQKRNLSNRASITAEITRSFRDIEANIIKMMERKKAIEKPQPKEDRGIGFGR